MTVFFRRLIEYFSVGILASVLCTCFLLNAVETTTVSIVFMVMLLCLTLNIIHLTGCLREHWYCVYDEMEYFVINITVFLIYAATNLILATKNIEPIYTYMFLPYKLLTVFGVSKLTSAIWVNLIMMLFIVIVPFAARPRGKERFRGY